MSRTTRLSAVMVLEIIRQMSRILADAWRAMHHMLLASARAVAVFRELKLPGMVGLVSDSYPIAVLTDNEAHRKSSPHG